MSVDCEGEMTINGSLAPSLRIIGTDRNNTETYRSRVFLKADSLGYAAGVHFMSGGTGNWWIGTAYSGYGPYQFSINYYAGAENQAVAHQNTAKQLLAWTTSGQMGVYLPAPATPTARLHLPAGTATASTAPLKFTVGVNLTTPESGAVEYDGSNFYITTSTPTRLAIATLPVAEVDNGNSGTAKTITWANGSHQKVTLTGNCTFTFTAPSTVRTVTLKVISGGAYTATWPGSVIWSGDPPVLSQVAGTYDLISLYWDGSNYIGATSTPKITTYTDTGSIAELDELVIANKATPFTLTLPAAISGSFKKIKNIGAGTVTLDGASTDTLDDELTQDVAQWECMSLACYTTGKWAIV